MGRLRLARRYAWGLAQMRSSDVLVASFPRSGSTHLRLILAGLATSDAAAIQSHTQFERTVPELGGPTPWDRQPEGPLFIKTHRPHAFLLSRPRAILLLRHPLNALASFHAYQSARVGGAAMPTDAFLRHSRFGLPRWIDHTRSWISRAEHVLRFNALCADPAEEVARMMQVLQVTSARDRLEAAVARATPEAAHRLRSTRQGGDQFDPSFEFARSNRDQPRASFSAEDEAWASRQLELAGLMPLVETL
ncbi:MAG: sulfotransferase domain-containing protein [Rubricoccaceae bacterium]